MLEQINKRVQSFLKSELNIDIPLNAIDLKNGWIFKKQKPDNSIDFHGRQIEQSIEYETKDEMISRGLDYIVWKNTIDKNEIKMKYIVLVDIGSAVYRADLWQIKSYS